MTVKSKPLYVAMLLLLAGAYFLSDTYFAIGEFHAGGFHLIAIFITAVGAAAFLCSPDVDRFMRLLRLSGILALPYILCLIVSTLICIFQFTEIRQMISGFFQIIYMLIAIFAAGSILYLLEEQAVPCIFWGLTLAYSVMALLQMREVGVGEFFRQFYTLLASGASETPPAMDAMESPCFAYSYAMFFAYFVCFKKKEKRFVFWCRIIVCVFFLLLGLKRSAILAMTAGLIAAFIFRVIPLSWRKLYLHIMIAALCLFAVFMIPFIRYGLFARVTEFFHINVMGRNTIYQYYADYYEISPFYFGKGLGWVADFLRNLRNSVGYTWMASVHDDYIRSYIELGFWGYIFWILSTFLWLPKKMVSLQDTIHSAVIIGCIIFYAVLFMTENMFFHFKSMLVWATIMMASSSTGMKNLSESYE